MTSKVLYFCSDPSVIPSVLAFSMLLRLCQAITQVFLTNNIPKC